MRQQKVRHATLTIIAFLALSVITFIVVRSRPWSARPASHTHEHTSQGHGEHSNEDHAADNTSPKSQVSGRIENGVRIIQIVARQFEFTPSRIVIRKGQPVRLELVSRDVEHGFAIDDLNIDRRLPPGQEVTVSFTPEKSGEHHFHCSVYCGRGHADMHGQLVVLDLAGE